MKLEKTSAMRAGNIILAVGVVLILIVVSYLESCTHQPVSAADLEEVCFEFEVLPIFLNSCAITGCHDGSGDNEYVFTSYEGILEGVERGNARGSKVYKVLTDIWSDEMMPPDQPLSVENRTIIRLWIDQGANYTVCPDKGVPGIDDDYYNPVACFDRDIMPVILSRCAIANCHDDVTAEEGYRLTSYSGVMQIVSPGNPGSSKLYEVITKNDPADVMPPPPNQELTTAQIDSIYAWISYGALDAYCGEPCDTITPVTYSGVISPIIVNSCVGCHSGSTPSGGVSLENYSSIAGLAANGRLLGVLKAEGYPMMPPSGSFSQCRIRQFEIWIDGRYPNN